MNRFEKMFVPKVFNAIQAQISSFTREIRTEGIEKARQSMDRTVINGRVSEVIKEIYTTVGVYFASRTARELRVQEKKAFGINPEWISMIEGYFRMHLLTKAVLPITSTTKEQILQLLIRAQNEGWGVDRVISELEAPELTLWRARMIVRTETNKAHYYGAKLGEKESKFESTKMWIAANDHRTRHSHFLVSGDRIDVNQKFSVPIFKNVGGVEVRAGVDLMDGPGDPEASAGNVINCRCTLVRRLKRDENGRLIAKRGDLIKI